MQGHCFVCCIFDIPVPNPVFNYQYIRKRIQHGVADSLAYRRLAAEEGHAENRNVKRAGCRGVQLVGWREQHDRARLALQHASGKGVGEVLTGGDADPFPGQARLPDTKGGDLYRGLVAVITPQPLDLVVGAFEVVLRGL